MRRNPCFDKCSWLLVVAAMMTSRGGHASNPYLEAPAPSEVQTSPAYRYANATNDEVRAWIAQRQLPFVETPEPVPGVRLPGRLTGRLHGVWIHGTDVRHVADSPYEILDGRLALALDDFCRLLADNGFVELVHFTILRPKPAAKGPLTRHPGALAIDVGELKRDDGTWLRVKRDFDAAIGAKTCGAGATLAESDSGKFLQRMLCEARTRGIFHYALTPHFDATHADHFHLEIKPMVMWFLYN